MARFEGLQHFKGKLVHSANWDDSIDFTGKKIAVIGGGSSAIQIIPKFAKGRRTNQSEMGLLLKSCSCISPNIVHSITSLGITCTWYQRATENDPDMDDSFNYTPEVIDKFKSEPEFCQEHRQALINRRIVNFRRSLRESEIQRDAQKLFREKMTDRLGNS